MDILITFALSIPAIFVAITVHEFTRAAVSTALGDTKPKEDGRLTLNPFKHFEPIGFILMLGTGFGWGKPVETRAINYKNRKQGVLLTAILPTVANLVAAAIFTVIYKVTLMQSNYIISSLALYIMNYNVLIAVYNLVPVTPMDCLKVLSVLLPANTYFKYMRYEKTVQMLFLLFLFMGYTSFIFAPIIRGIEELLFFIFV